MKSSLFLDVYKYGACFVGHKKLSKIFLGGDEDLKEVGSSKLFQYMLATENNENLFKIVLLKVRFITQSRSCLAHVEAIWTDEVLVGHPDAFHVGRGGLHP